MESHLLLTFTRLPAKLRQSSVGYVHCGNHELFIHSVVRSLPVIAISILVGASVETDNFIEHRATKDDGECAFSASSDTVRQLHLQPLHVNDKLERL